jgi:crossover junction endodeoxyribonuclease RuvC
VKVLAIDPGSQRTGYAVFETSSRDPKLSECGVVFVKGKDLPERLLSVHKGIERLVRRHKPRHVVIETPFVGKNPSSALVLTSARAVCMLAAAAAKARVFDYAPSQVKRAVTMSGLSQKSDVQRSVQLLLGLRDLPPPDAADALALGLCHLNRIEA